MNLSTELLIGIVLIGLGLLLGAAAYMVLSSRGEPEDDSDESMDDDHLEPDDEMDLEGEAEPEVEASEEVLASEVDEVEPTPSVMSRMDEGPPAPSDDELQAALEPAAESELSVVSTKAPVETETMSDEPQPGPRIQVATLLRDEVTGALIVKVGDREYQTATELQDSQDWTRVEYAASDLSKWIELPEQRTAPDREAEPGERGGPKSMIEQINAILQEKIETSGKSHLAVRLIEGPGGSARVLIGVHSYELGEVPDESVNELIRAAVAEWEAGS